MFKKPSFFEHFYDLTGPKYAEKYEDSDSGLKNIRFLPKTPQKHDFMVICFILFGATFFGALVGSSQEVGGWSGTPLIET